MSAAEQSLPTSNPALSFERMQAGDLPDVLAIENDVFPFPWGRASFLNCLSEGYECWVVRGANDAMLGYFIVMHVVDEAHLLTFALRRDTHGRGGGKTMLDKVVSVAYALGVDAVFLEVRPSNERAISLYQHFGFATVGRRKNYYPAANNTREDAIMMRLPYSPHRSRRPACQQSRLERIPIHRLPSVRTATSIRKVGAALIACFHFRAPLSNGKSHLPLTEQ
jgi:ribosomal-protein-alanine N-acetyltransferase